MKRSMFVLSFVAVAGCSAPSGPPVENVPEAGPPCDFGMEIGTIHDAVFTPFQNGDTAKVLLGFQGFRFIEGAARFNDTDAETIFLHFQITFQNHSPIVQDRAAVVFSAPDGTRLADNVQIFFNDIPMFELLEESPLVNIRATAGTCTSKLAMSLKLEDGGTCDALTQGGMVFPDGGGPCADAGL